MVALLWAKRSKETKLNDNKQEYFGMTPLRGYILVCEIAMIIITLRVWVVF